MPGRVLQNDAARGSAMASAVRLIGTPHGWMDRWMNGRVEINLRFSRRTTAGSLAAGPFPGSSTVGMNHCEDARTARNHGIEIVLISREETSRVELHPDHPFHAGK
jgi:hypothetical protein